MSWTSTIRRWYDELFTSKLVIHLQDENQYLRNQVEQMRIENGKLQLFLNTVNPAAAVLARKQNPPRRPDQSNQLPATKRWADIERERYAELEQDRLKKIAEAQTA